MRKLANVSWELKREWPLDDNDDQWLMGGSSSMTRISKHIERAAEVGCSVLFTGETGTGKEIFARLLHSSGVRSQNPFVPVNCAALTVTLAESQLFGHEKGAFTGAVGSSLGVFRSAERGVVFLDEVGEMPLELQPKLLRVLQEQEVTPVGSSIPVPINVQVIAATNRNLEDEVAKGKFREDLYYRLNMVEMRVPPLRERPEDIPAFIEFFAQKFARRYQRPIWQPDAAVVTEFCQYNWPGNVRQLGHVIEQAYVLETSPSLPSSEQKSREINLRLPYLNLDKLRYEAVRQALTATQGHKGRAAQLLGVHANTLTRMLTEFQMTPSHWSSAPSAN